MAAQRLLRAQVRVAWWLPICIHTLAIFCALHDREPDLEKLRAIVARTVTVKLMSEPKKPCERCQRVRRAFKSLLPAKKR